MGGRGELLLAAAVLEIRRPQRHLDAAGVQPGGTEPHGHAVCQQGDAGADLVPGGEVFPEGGAVAHGLHRLPVVPGADRLMLQSVGVLMELEAQLAHEGLQHLRLAGCQLADGPDAELIQGLLGRPAHEQQGLHRQGPDQVPPAVRGDDGGGVGLFVVAAQLGEDLVEADPHGEGQAELPADPVPDAVGDGLRVAAEEMGGAGDVQPALIDTEGLHQIGVLLIDGVDLFGILPVEVVVGRQEHQIRVLLLGLPDGLRRPDAEAFCRFVLGQNDAVAGGGVAAHRRGHVPQVRMAQQLHGGVKAVQVTVQNDAVLRLHGIHPPLRRIYHNSLPQNTEKCHSSAKFPGRSQKSPTAGGTVQTGEKMIYWP